MKDKELLKSKIDRAKVVSFDIFDTLLFRKTNTPETVFDLVGRHFGIDGFRKLRMDAQDEASRRAYASHQAPHANMDEIYEVLSEHTEHPVDWSEVKAYEIRLEGDALEANREMLDIFRYAKSQGKRVVATSDMYLFADTLRGFLEARGYTGFDHVYCSADEQKAKFNKELFALVAQREGVAYGDILHIGDKERDDGAYPASFGMDTFVYDWPGELEKVKSAAGSDVDTGLYKLLYDEDKGFWYNLGAEVGGPLYMGLYRFVRERAAGRKIYFLSRDGYDLYHIFKALGHEDVEYLYTSRRALTLACIRELDEASIAALPPYTYGQTVGEILDYLRVDRAQIRHLREAGLKSFDQTIATQADMAAFRRLYKLDGEVFLARCALERENALAYFQKIGFFEGEAVCFDCGWQGSSQVLMDRFLEAVGQDADRPFLYFGIKNCDKSRAQLRGRHYETYLFDFYKNYSLQADLAENVVMYELFFTAPHESVYHYGPGGDPVFEDGDGDLEKAAILDGILDYLRAGLPFVEKYGVEYTPELAVGHLTRLIHRPTETEAVQIGSLQNVDGFARRKGEAQYIAYLTQKQLRSGAMPEVYWPEGLLKRPDVPESVKKEYARKTGRQYPPEIPEYHLEDGESIRRYHSWLANQQSQPEPEEPLERETKFSVVIPVYNTVTEQLEECIQSVLGQTYRNFELILVDDHSSWDNVRPVLKKYEQRENVRVIYRERNGHISVATNDGIAIASGEFIVFMDCDDTIAPNALYAFAAKLDREPELDFLYSDEDKITEDGKIRHMPFFKPDWSPDLFLNMMYTNHLSAYRTSLVRAVGGLRTAYNGSQDYDFTLRFLERCGNARVGHVAKILYHWRERKESVAYAIGSKNYAAEAARHAKEDYIRRNGLDAWLEPITGMAQYRIVYNVEGSPLVSIIIPSKDHPEILEQCIDSIRAFTRYRNYEIVVVDNGSRERDRAKIAAYLESVGATYLYEAEPFNFSRMCDKGAAQARGEYLLFLNDDIELFQPDWLERMLGHAQQPHIGAVGAKLFYPGTTRLQHSGISNTETGPEHSFLTLDDQYPYYFGWNRVDNDCIAVTGACLMVSAEKFREVGGFDESYPIAYNDVKLCFALHEKGYYNVVRNDVAAYHHESLSRGSDVMDQQKRRRLMRELDRLYTDFPDLRGRDPFLSRHLAHWSAGLDLKHTLADLEPMDLSQCRRGGRGYLDSIHIGETARIQGWSYLWGAPHTEKLERYIVFRDPFGRTCGAPILPMPRPDVSRRLGLGRKSYPGFVCDADRSGLRFDLFAYKVGIVTVSRKGERYLCWLGTTPAADPMPRSLDEDIPEELQELELADLHEPHGKLEWSLDECRRTEDGWRLVGFAFQAGGEHYRYRTSLVFRSEEDAYELAMEPAKRLDVACTYPKEHYLYETGFSCELEDADFPKAGDYEVVIRLTDRFDPQDIQDIPTGEILEIGRDED